VNQHKRASELVQRYVDGLASADETWQLADLLRADSAARQEFLEYLNIDLALEDYAAAGEANPATSVKVDRRIPRRRWRGAVAVAMAVVLMVAFAIWTARNRTPNGIDRPPLSFVAAEILGADGVRWVG
jgi:ferric-dicitrate binding protein FerR (iron transport regulator)